MDAMDAVVGRISPAQLTEPGPSGEQLQSILLAAVCAPDHGRMQPWRFVVIQGAGRIRFGELMALSLKRRDPTAPEDRLEAERKKALRAPVIIIVAAVPEDNPRVPAIEQIVAVGAATQNILIAAHALGLGAFWRTGPVAYDADVKKAFGLSEADTVVGIVYVGSVRTPGKPRVADVTSVVRQW